MPIALNGIRVHDNVNQIWFNVYPEKQKPSGVAGANSVTVVFGGTFNDNSAGKIRGSLIRNGEEILMDYPADVKAGETHVFEQTFALRKSDDTFKVLLVDVTPNRPANYPSYLLNVSYSFIIDNPDVDITAPESEPPAPNTFPSFPDILPVISDVVNWVSKGTFPSIPLLNMQSADFGNMLGVVAKALGDTVAKPLENFPSFIDTLNTLPTSLSSIFGSLALDLVTNFINQGSDLIANRMLSTMQGTPAAIKSANELNTEILGSVFNRYALIANPETYIGQVPAGTDKMPAYRQQVTDAVNILVEMDRLNFGLSLASLGQVRVVADEIQMLEGTFGAGGLVHDFYNIRQEKAVTKQLEYYFNSQYLPEIPSTQDLINMVVKEKMTIDQFKAYMEKRGFNREWSQLIWDAHFRAPDLNDVLTAWRRGIIDEKRVDELMLLIDLDPVFKQIFDTRKYQDPPLSITRLMFETGAIPADDVPKYVHRLGYAPEFEAAITEFILHFQERRYRTRYITQLMTALAQDKATEEEVRTAVSEIGFTAATADLIVKTALLRRKTYASTSSKTVEKALTLSELKKAYSDDIITEDYLRTQMSERGYNLQDIDITLALLNKDKLTEQAGTRTVALTIAEMVSAWRYGVIEEEQLRTNLLTRGLDLNEVNIMIETKKKQWGIGAA